MTTAGNVNFTPKQYIFWIYDNKTLQPKASVVIPDNTVINDEVMGEHYIQFSFNLDSCVSFKRGDYIKYNGLHYRLREDCQPTEVNLKHYTYELKLEAPEMFFQDCIMFYTMQGYKEVEWVLYGNASQFIDIAADNISAYLGEEWKAGIIEPGDNDIQNIAFDSNNVFNSLTEIAEAFGAEWYVDYTLKTINMVYQQETEDIITLRRETELTDIKQAKDSSEAYCNRLFAFGSTRNIPKNYRQIDQGGVVDAIVQKKLRLPADVGDYIDAYPDMKRLDIVEQVKIFEDIYPKRIGTITEIRTVEKEDDGGNPFIIYFFKDSGLNFKSEYILPNETLMLQFGNNSWLNGRDFELSYNDKTEEFEILNIEEGENYVPNDILKPKAGDEYVLYGFDISLVGDQYVPEAEEELEAAAREYLQEVSKDTATYTCSVNPVYRFANNLDLPLGQRVRLKSLIFESGEKLSRVYGYRKYPVTGKDEYVVGDVMDYKRLDRMDNQTEENKKVADVQYLEAMKLANNAYTNAKALGYLRRALENETMIDKGLLLTTLIRLGAIVGNEWMEKAGINGAAMNADEVVAYFGGSLNDAVEGNTPIGFKMDGSGWLANQNILWDALGNLLVSGKFESNKDNGSKIVIDPDTRSFKMLDSNGEKEVLTIDLKEREDGTFTPNLRLNLFDENGNITYSCELSPYEFRFYENNTGYQCYLRPNAIGFFNQNDSSQPSFSAYKDTNTSGSLFLNAQMVGLPITDPNINGRLFKTGKALNIS
jgi:hypothetical protein